jgi:hypothetical protein
MQKPTLSGRFGRRSHGDENDVTEDDLLAFIASAIGSIWAIELLLLLKHDPGRGWDSASLVRELRSSSIVVDEALERLRVAGLVIQCPAGLHRYHAAPPELDEIASELEQIYRTKPTAVIRAIVGK